jgi:hypothetical protein
VNIRKGRRGLEGKVRDRPRPTIINPFHARGLPSRVIGSDIPFKHVGIKLNEPYSRFRKKPKAISNYLQSTSPDSRYTGVA